MGGQVLDITPMISLNSFRMSKCREACTSSSTRPCSGCVAPSARVKWAVDPTSATLQHMGRDHGCPHVLVSQAFLYRPDIVAVLEKMGRKTVPPMPTSA